MNKYIFKVQIFFVEKEDVALNKAWKMVVKNTLAKCINKKFENSDICEFSINITMDYEKNVEVSDSNSFVL